MVSEKATVDECMAMVRENQPEEYFKFGDRIETRLEKMLQRGGDDKQFTLTQYRGITADDSPRLDLSLSVILYGDSGKAKTDFAMAQGKHPLLVQTWCDLKKIKKGVTDLLVFDVLAMLTNLTPQMWIYILDLKQNRRFAKQDGASVLYGSATIWAGIKKIFVTNVPPLNDPDELHPLIHNGHCEDPAMQVAIRRRYRVVGPVKRRLATPTSSWGNFLTQALAKDKEASAPLGDDEASDAETTISRASILSKQLLTAAHMYRAESGVPTPSSSADGFW
jgi:hypothetical protein